MFVSNAHKSDAHKSNAHKDSRADAKAVAADLLASVLPLMKSPPPVNLSVICDRLGIEVYTMPCDTFGAMYSRSPRGDKKFLLANDKQPQGRFRFSIAHELGHILLNHEPLRHIYELREPAMERQADYFAAELLLPERFLRSDCESYTAPELAKRYKVSRQSLELQLNNLGLAALPPPFGHPPHK